MTDQYYHDYLQLSKILDSQKLVSEKKGKLAHDEMLFIIIHQSFELWFFEILYELKSVVKALEKSFNDNDETFPEAIHKLDRVKEIWKLLVQQYDVLETMTAQDFLDFRSFLNPASGFQSYQFKSIEAILGLTEKTRFQPLDPDKINNENVCPYYKRIAPEDGAFTTEHHEFINSVENSTTLFNVMVEWLQRLPFFEKEHLEAFNRYWDEYVEAYEKSLSDTDLKKKLHEQLSLKLKNGIEISNELQIPLTAEENKLFVQRDKEYLKKYKTITLNRFDGNCVKAALFIFINRDLPLFHLPHKFLNLLMDIDELISMWRYKHLLIVKKIIGQKTGTGNTSGADYLKSIVDYNVIYPELKVLPTFLMERKNMPTIPESLKKLTLFKI